jgi:hypothetical protein
MLGLNTPYRLGSKQVSKGIGKGSMHIVETTMIYFLKENTHSLQVHRTHRIHNYFEGRLLSHILLRICTVE